MELQAYHTVLDAPVGPLTLAATDQALQSVWFGPPTDHGAPARHLPRHDAHPILRAATAQLREYFDRARRVFDLPLAPDGTPFQLQCWRALQDIPFGETRTYQQQALAVGDINKTRAVGAANGANPIGIIIPCHRVLGKDGALVGFGGGLHAKAWLLRFEREQVSPQLSLL